MQTGMLCKFPPAAVAAASLPRRYASGIPDRPVRPGDDQSGEKVLYGLKA
jgi:hypothetical protein